MDWALIIAALIIGLVLGYVAHSLFSRNHDTKSGNKAFEQAKLELSQHKQEVADHFDEHYQHLHQLTEQLNRLNKHWNEASARLLADESNKQLLTFNAVVPEANTDTSEQDRDAPPLTAVEK